MLLPEYWKCLLAEFRILGFRLQNIAVGIQNPRSTDIRIPKINVGVYIFQRPFLRGLFF